MHLLVVSIRHNTCLVTPQAPQGVGPRERLLPLLIPKTHTRMIMMKILSSQKRKRVRVPRSGKTLGLKSSDKTQRERERMEEEGAAAAIAENRGRRKGRRNRTYFGTPF